VISRLYRIFWNKFL